MRRRELLVNTAAFAALAAAVPPQPAFADGIALFDADVHLISPDTNRYPRVAAGSADQGGEMFTGHGDHPDTKAERGRTNEVPRAESVLRWTGEANVTGAAIIQSRSIYGYDNDYLLDSGDHYPAIFNPVVMVDVTKSSAANDLRGMISGRGAAAVRLTGKAGSLADSGWFASDDAQKIWDVAADTGIAVELMYVPAQFSSASLSVMAILARKYPKVRMMIDHMGWPKIEGAPNFGLTDSYPLLAKLPNVSLKFSTLNLDLLEQANIPADEFVAHAVSTLGAGNIMWGSALGHAPGTYNELVARGRRAARKLSAADRAKVMHDNGKGFYIRGGLKT